ncbi:helix-turn-helix domain-containing protein (plasmid) [Brevundimonas olei]|uniref:Helix-turn-helix domain-containing protein n=1 Tax=Brevundimonas olei TaxID=657642 RepID=A0ABZ2IKH1_9CAUL
MTYDEQTSKGPSGLRKITAGLRLAERAAASWCGLPAGGSKTRLLEILEDIPAATLGVSKGALAYLHLTLKLQPSACFQNEPSLRGADLARAGLALVSTYPDAYLAEKLDVSVRTLARYRAELAAARLIVFRDSPAKGRFRSGPAESPDEAFGIDLRPVVSRYAELMDVREKIRAAAKLARSARRSLSSIRNRIRSLLPLLSSASDQAIAAQAIAAIDAVRRRKDPDFINMGLTQAQASLSLLEAAVDHHVSEIVHMTQTTPEPVEIGAQLHPTSFPSDLKKDFEVVSKAEKQSVCPQGQPGEDEAHRLSEEDVIYFGDYNADQEAEDAANGAEWIEISLSDCKPFQRVQLPTVERVIQSLPTLLARKAMRYVSHPDLIEPEDIVAAYGQASAARIGFSRSAILALSEKHGRLTFAIAALLTEYTETVKAPLAYLLGILEKIDSSWEVANLRLSWDRLMRNQIS